MVAVALIGCGNRPPTAEIIAPQHGAIHVTAGEEVSFQGRGEDPEGKPISYKWDFDDSTTCPPQCGSGTEKAPTHVYRAPGTYHVKLTVSDGKKPSEPAKIAILVYASPAEAGLAVIKEDDDIRRAYSLYLTRLAETPDEKLNDRSALREIAGEASREASVPMSDKVLDGWAEHLCPMLELIASEYTYAPYLFSNPGRGNYEPEWIGAAHNIWPRACQPAEIQLSWKQCKYALGVYAVALQQYPEACFELIAATARAITTIRDDDAPTILGDIIIDYSDALIAQPEGEITDERAKEILTGDILPGLDGNSLEAVGEAFGLKVEELTGDQLMEKIADKIVKDEQKLLQAVSSPKVRCSESDVVIERIIESFEKAKEGEKD